MVTMNEDRDSIAVIFILELLLSDQFAKVLFAVDIL
jgi:hypothetical protein